MNPINTASSHPGWRVRPSRACSLLPWALVCALLAAGCGEGGSPRDPAAQVVAARARMARNEGAAAIIHLKNALQANPELPEARFMLGQVLLDSGQGQAAEVELRRALDLKHPQDVVVPVLARAVLLQGESGRVIRQFGLTELQAPNAVADLKTSLAAAHLQQADRSRARNTVQAALAASPDYPRARIFLARLEAADGRLNDALAISEGLVQATPADANGWLLRGDLLAASHAEPKAVLDAYQQAVNRQPTLVAAQIGLMSTLLVQADRAPVGVAMAAMRKALPQHPQLAYFEGVLALEAGDMAPARRIADRLVGEEPARPEFLRLAGAVAMKTGDFSRAETLLASAVQAAPGDAMLRQMLTQVYLRNGRPEQAVATVQPVLAKGAVPAETLALAALAHLQTGDAGKARTLYEAAARLQPRDTGTRTLLALSRVGGGDVERGVGELKDMAAAEPGVAADMALVAGLMARRDFARALQAIAALERKQPKDPVAPMLRGRVALASGDLAGARRAFEQVLALAPQYFPAHRALAVLDLKANRGDLAQQRLEAVLKSDPKNIDALQALVQMRGPTPQAREQIEKLYTQAIQAAPARADTRVLLVQHLIRFRDYRRAVEVAQEGLGALPGDVRLLQALGQAQTAAGDLPQAMATYTSWAAAEPASAQPQMALARARLAAGDKTGALRSVQRALELQPGHPQALQALVELDLSASQPGAALALAQKLQREHPDDATGFATEAQVRTKLKQWEPAIAAYRAALKREPEREDLAIRLHAALLWAGRPAEAEQLAAGWIKAQPAQVGMQLYLGDRALGRQDYRSAETHLLAVVKLDPANAPALNDLAWVTLKLKKPGALAFAEKAYALASSRPETLDTLALAQADAGQIELAVATQLRAVALKPRQPMFRLNLARLYLQSGQKALARTELEQLAALGESFPARSEVAALQKQL